MDQVVQANAAQTEELSSTAHDLAAEAERLQSLVARFTLAGPGAAAGPPPREAGPSEARGPDDEGRPARVAPGRRDGLRLAPPVACLERAAFAAARGVEAPLVGPTAPHPKW
jgi:methyl-accepting chemotaxis protein